MWLWEMSEQEVLALKAVIDYRIVLVGQCTSLLLFTNLLLYAHWYGGRMGKKSVHPTMRLFLLFHILGIASSLPGTFQRVFRLFDPAKNLMLFFWFFATFTNYSASISPFFVLFLTVERLVILRFPLILPKYRNHFLATATLLAALLYSISFSFFLAELPLDPIKALVNCAPMVCISPKFKNVPQTCFRLALGTCNLVCSILFIRLLNNSELKKKIKNRVVKFTITCEIVFNIVPSTIKFIITMIFFENATRYFGPLESVTTSVDSAICSIFYTWIYLYKARVEWKKSSSAGPAVGVIGAEQQKGRLAFALANSDVRATTVQQPAE